MQRMGKTGEPSGAAFPVAEGIMAAQPILAGTSSGEILAFAGYAAGEPEQAYVTLLQCGP